jgi:hypothetical protein
VLSELYKYFIDKELQHRDDPIVCLDKKKPRIKSIQKILSVFQYPHLIEAITLIDFVPV